MLTMHSHHWNWRLPSFPHLTWDTQNLTRKLEDGSKIWSHFSTIWSLSSLFLKVLTHSVSSVTQLCPILSDPMNYIVRQASLSITSSWSLLKHMSIESVMPSKHLTFCHPFLLLPAILPSIRIFSNELAVCIRWPKNCSFSFSISPSNKYSFRTDFF